MRTIIWLLIFFLVSALSACEQSALLTMRRQNEEAQRRIIEKEQELVYLDAQNRALLENRDRLVDELDNRQMTLNDLNERLGDLRRENARLKAGTDSQRRQQQEIEFQIQRYQDEIASLENNPHLSVAEKTKRKEELEQQIRDYLKLITKM